MADDIHQLLAELGIGKYANAFAENEIDLDAARYLSDDDLKELGLPMGPRRKFAAAIERLSPEPYWQSDAEVQPEIATTSFGHG